MLLVSKINILIIVLYFLLQNVNSTNYISLKLLQVDDCVRLVNISNKIVFNFSDQNIYPDHCDCDWIRKGPCDANNWAHYCPDSYLIKNYEYEFMTAIEITFEDWNWRNGFMAIDIYLNEYYIRYQEQTFWECRNCYIENENERGQYLYKQEPIWINGVRHEVDVLAFHPGNETGCDCGPRYYTFTLRINNITDLYKGGTKSPFIKTDDYYSFKDEETITKYVNYSDSDIELELINFNQEAIVCAKSNKSLEFVNNGENDFIYKICVVKEEGELEGLDPNNRGNDKNVGECFNETSGLNYTLSDSEKEKNITQVKLNVSVFKYCPENKNEYPYCDPNVILEEKEYTFVIIINHPPLEPTEQTTTTADSSEQTSTPTHSTEQTSTQSHSTEQSEKLSTSDSSTNAVTFDCLDDYFSRDDKNAIYSHLCPNFTTNDILDNMEEVVNKIEENKTYKIIGKDFIAQVVPIDYLDENNTNNNNEIFSNSSHTNFTECEKILREHYKIESPRKITFIQVELNNTNDDILVKQIEYQVYDDNQTLLNLSLCNKTNLTVYYTLKDDKQEEVDLISDFKKNGIDILDINDKFFNDVCLSYSDSDNDLTLNDRIKDIYKNYSFCEKNCILLDINFEEYKATCDCTIKDNMNAKDFNFDVSKALIEKKNNNYKIIKCHNGFTIKDNLANLGFWIFLGLMLLNILLLILYICGLKSIKTYISQEMANNGYVGRSDQAFCHNYVKKLDKLIDRLNKMKSDFIKKNEPPKRRKGRKKRLKNNSEGNGLISLKNSSNNKENLGDKIKLLKSRMDKTKRVRNFSSTNDVLIKDGKKKIGSTKYVQNNNFHLNLININVNEVKKKTYIPNISEQILNIYSFKEAIEYDKRSFFTIYYIFLIAKQVIMHAVFFRSPIEPLPIRLSLLKFMLGCDLALNAIFYTDDKVSEKYNSTKSAITFAFTNNLSVLLLSTLIGYVMFIFLANLNNSTNQIRNLFKEEEDKLKSNPKYTVSLLRKKEIVCEVKRIMRNHKIKIIIFYIVEYACMIFFWYYVTIFCNIYKKTQLSWLLDSLLTIIIRIMIDFLLNIILALFYKLSIWIKSSCLYRVMIFLYSFS